MPLGRRAGTRGTGTRLVAAALMTGLLSSCAGSFAGLPRAQQAAAIDAYLRRHNFYGAVFVTHEGKVVLDKAYGFADPSRRVRNTTRTVFAIGSLTKSFTAAAIMRLVHQGKLRLDERIGHYVPELDFEPWRRMTIRELLSHTSGMWKEAGVDEQDAPFLEVAKRNRGTPLYCPPGTCWNYSNWGYETLAFILERVTGTSYEDYVREAFFEPLHLRSTGATVGPRKVRDEAIGGLMSNGELAPTATAGEAAAGVGVAAGGIYSTTNDLYRWVQALRGGRVLPSGMFRDMVKGHSPTGFGPYDKYGYGWLSVNDGSAFWHAGGLLDSFTGFVFVDEPRDVVAIALSNDYGSKDLMFDRVIDFERDARDRARGFGWILPLASAIGLTVALGLIVRVVVQLTRRRRTVVRPTLRRFVVLAVVPALLGYLLWRGYIPMLKSAGPPAIAMTVAQLWIWRVIALVAVYVVLLSIAVYSVTRRREPADRLETHRP
jgi:CubicO group peptidase (beta-lactamase class C family)